MWTLPNLVTLVRILLLPVFLWEIWQNDFRAAALIFFIAGISDGLDGWLARRLNQFSRVGEKLDPVADKLLLISSFLILTIPGRGYEPIPLWLTAAVILRDIFIVVTALIVRSVTGFSRFRPSFWGKLSTTIQMGTIVAFVVINAFSWNLRWLLEFGYVLTGFMTVFSGLHYIFHLRLLLAEYRKEHA